MKKLKLNFSNFETAEVLTRDELKKIVGGDESGSGVVCNREWCVGDCVKMCGGEPTMGTCYSTSSGGCACAVAC